MSDFGLIGADAGVSVEIGQLANGATPNYNAPVIITVLNNLSARGTRLTEQGTAELASTRGIGNQVDLKRFRFGSYKFPLEYRVTASQGRIFKDCLGCYCRVTFDVNSALANPDILEGIISNIECVVSDEATIETATIDCFSDHQ